MFNMGDYVVYSKFKCDLNFHSCGQIIDLEYDRNNAVTYFVEDEGGEIFACSEEQIHFTI